MKPIWIIAKRELKSFFDSLIAYIMLIAFVGFTGFFTWIYGSDIFFIGQASLQVFFEISYWTLFFFIPALTMRLLAEENRVGTIELLLTKPVTDWQVVVGKFLSTLILIAIAVALTLPYYITVANLGNVDHGAVLTGYFGLLLMSAAYISIGLFASSITNNQLVAFLITLFIGIFFHIISNVISQSVSGWASQLFNYLSIQTHFNSIARGVIDTRNLVYFASLILLGLIGTEAVLTRRNLSE